MANKITITDINNTVTITPQSNTNVDINSTNTPVTVTQGTTSVVTVNTPGPQGPQGNPGTSPGSDADIIVRHITASGNISASGYISASTFVGEFVGDGSGLTNITTGEGFPYTGDAVINGTLSIEGNGNITASNNLKVEGFTTLEGNTSVDANLTVGTGYRLKFTNENVGLYRESNNLRLAGFNSIQFLGEATNMLGQAERMRIDSTTGNVGINTASPSAKLDVNGNINVSTTENIQNIIRSDGGFKFVSFLGSSNEDIQYLEAGSSGRTLQWRTNGDAIFQIKSQNSGLDQAYVNFIHVSGNPSNFSVGTSQDDGSFIISRASDLSSNKHFVITGSNGFIGINEPNPAHQLTVGGIIKAADRLEATYIRSITSQESYFAGAVSFKAGAQSYRAAGIYRATSTNADTDISVNDLILHTDNTANKFIFKNAGPLIISGSGNTALDVRGPITSSGAISASGDIITTNITASGKILATTGFRIPSASINGVNNRYNLVIEREGTGGTFKIGNSNSGTHIKVRPDNVTDMEQRVDIHRGMRVYDLSDNKLLEVEQNNDTVNIGASNTSNINIYGNVTASGAISASGDVYAQNIRIPVVAASPGKIIGSDNKFFQLEDGGGRAKLSVYRGYRIFTAEGGSSQKLDVGTTTVKIMNANLSVASHITASGNISASGDIFATSMSLGRVTNPLGQLHIADNGNEVGSNRFVVKIPDNSIQLGTQGSFFTDLKFKTNGGVEIIDTGAGNTVSFRVNSNRLETNKIRSGNGINDLTYSALDFESSLFGITTVDPAFTFKTFNNAGSLNRSRLEMYNGDNGAVILQPDHSSGNVGIGTNSTPSAKLTVSGSVDIVGNTQIGGNLTISGSNSEIILISESAQNSNCKIYNEGDSLILYANVGSGKNINIGPNNLKILAQSNVSEINGFFKFDTPPNDTREQVSIQRRTGATHPGLLITGSVLIPTAPDLKTTNHIEVGTHITASGNISASGNLIIGDITGSGKISLSDENNNIIIGEGADVGTSNSSTAVGYQASGRGSRVVAIGYQAQGGVVTNGYENTGVGYQANYQNASVKNVSIGAYAGHKGTVESVSIGHSAGYNGADNGVFLGYQAGYNETSANKLYIENSNSSTPLIYGEFDNDIVRINGKLFVSNSLDITGSVTVGVVDITPPITTTTASLDCSLSNMFTLTLSSSENIHLTSSNITPGQSVSLRITQPDPSGSLTYDDTFKFPNGAPYEVSATSSVEDIVSFISFDSSTLYGSSLKNFE